MNNKTQPNADTLAGDTCLPLGGKEGSRVNTMRNYAAWPQETTEQEHVDGQNASYERFIGKHMASAAIAEYNSTWGEHHGHELTTRRSARRFANELAYAPEGNS